MSFQKTRMWILLTFVGSFALMLILSFICRFKELIPEGHYLQDLLLAVLKIYSVHFAIIVGTAFFKSTDISKPVNTVTFWTALSLSIIWNLLLVFRLCLFTFSSSDEITDLMKYLQDISLNSSFLIVGVLAYFFSNN